MSKKKRLTKAQKRRKKIKVFILEVVILIIVLIALFLFMKISKINRQDIGEVDTNELDQETLDRLNGYTDIALFGLDNRTNGDTNKGRSDVIIIASINNDTDEVKMVSVYRDTYLNQTNDSYNKANAAYGSGGAETAIEMLNKNLDLNIQDYATVDFRAVANCVDAVGGVEIELSDKEANDMTGYIEEVAEMTGKQANYLSAGGVYTLDGVQAVAYSRLRTTAGSDYKRTERQREVIGKIVEKAKGSDLGTLNKLADELLPDISTNLSYKSMLSLVTQVFAYEMGESTGFPFDKTTRDLSCGDTVIPADLETNVVKLHQFLYGVETYMPSATVTEYSDEIKNLTGVTASDADQ
ncbi:MAG: LCP family protein [Eubacterium sp.]|nr:LCP family protein [Eubacterium sp.]